MSGLKLTLQTSGMVDKIFYIVIFVCINICEPIKGLYGVYVAAVILMTLKQLKDRAPALTRDMLILALLWLYMAVLPFVNHSAYLPTDTAVIKYVSFIFLIFVIAMTRELHKSVLFFAAAAGFINVLATYYFFIFRSGYPEFAMKVYGRFPVGTEMGTKGYTAALCSHYSANGLYVAMTALALWSMILSGEYLRSKKKLLLYGAFGASMFALVLVEKRAHLLFAVSVIIFTYGMKYRRSLNKILGRLVIVAVPLLAAAVLGYYLMPETFGIVGRLGEMLTGENVDSGRFRFWAYALQLWKQNPVWGIGWNQFAQYYGRLTGWSVGTHNVYIQVLCECGLVGAAVFAAVVFLSLFKTMACLEKKWDMKGAAGNGAARSETAGNGEAMKGADRSGAARNGLLVYSVCVQLFFVLYSLTGSCLYDNTFFFYAAACGIGLSEIHRSKACKRLFSNAL